MLQLRVCCLCEDTGMYSTSTRSGWVRRELQAREAAARSSTNLLLTSAQRTTISLPLCLLKLPYKDRKTQRKYIFLIMFMLYLSRLVRCLLDFLCGIEQKMIIYIENWSHTCTCPRLTHGRINLLCGPRAKNL